MCPCDSLIKTVAYFALDTFAVGEQRREKFWTLPTGWLQIGQIKAALDNCDAGEVCKRAQCAAPLQQQQ